MELNSFLETLRNLIVDDKLEEALRAMLAYLQKHHVEQERPLAKEVYQFLSRLNTLDAKRREGSISVPDYTLEYNSISGGVLGLIDRIGKFESEQDFLANATGKGKLMHNIPNRMAVGQTNTCTVRIGALWEKIMRDFVATEYTKLVEDIDVTDIMKVELLSRDGSAFDIWTPNDADQKAKLSAFTEWIFEVTPKKVGKFPLYLKVSTVEKVEGERLLHNLVYSFSVEITTEEKLIEKVAQDTLPEWQAILPVLEEGKKKKPPLLAWGGMGKVLAMFAGLALVALVPFIYRKISQPSGELTKATFRMLKKLQGPTVSVNGQPTDDWAFTDDSMGVVVTGLFVDSTYNIAVTDSTWACAGTLRIKRPPLATYTLSCDKKVLELGIMTKLPISSVKVNDVSQTIAAQSSLGDYPIAKLSLQEGQYRIEVALADGAYLCIPKEFYLQKDTTISMTCELGKSPPTSTSGTSTSGENYSVTIWISSDFYHTNDGKSALMMDGATKAVRPVVKTDRVEFILKDVRSGSHKFEMVDHIGYFDCKPKFGEVDYNTTIYLDCPRRKGSISIDAPGIISYYPDINTLEVMVDKVKRKARREGKSSVFTVKNVYYGQKRELRLVAPADCGCTNAIQTVTVDAPTVPVKFDCSCQPIIG